MRSIVNNDAMINEEDDVEEEESDEEYRECWRKLAMTVMKMKQQILHK